MKLTDIKIDNFGVCQELSFPDISTEIVVIFGPNEAGKTTTMDFIRDTLFGPNASDLRSLQTVREVAPGGSILCIDTEGNHWDIRRQYGAETSLEVTINSQLYPASTLNRDLLGGLGPDIFHNVFTVGLGELRQLHQLNDTEAADFLYDMTTGFDRVSLGAILRRISKNKTAILDHQGNGELTLLRETKEKVKTKHDLATSQLNEWIACQNTIHSTEAVLADLQSRRDTLRTELSTLELSLRVYETIKGVKRLEDWLTNNQHAGTLSNEDTFRRLDQILQSARESERLATQTKAHDRRLLVLKEERAALEKHIIPQDLWLRIRAFTEMVPWISSMQRQLGEYESAPAAPRMTADVNAGTLLATDVDIQLLDQRLLKKLRYPARRLKAAKQRLEKAVTETQELQQRISTAERSWLEDPNWDNVESAPNIASPVIAIADEYAACKRNIKDLRVRLNHREGDVSLSLPQSEDKPTGRELGNLLFCAIVFSTGGSLLGMGLLFPATFGLPTGAAIFCALLGLTAVAGGVFGQYQDAIKRRRRTELEARAQEFQRNRTPHADPRKLIDEIQTELQISLNTLAQLSNLKKQAASIERLRISLETSRDRISNLSMLVDESQADWIDHLRQAGIQAVLTPAELYEAVKRVDDFHNTQLKQLDQQSLQLRHKTELAELEERLNVLLREMPGNTDTLCLKEKLETLASITSRQQRYREDQCELDAEIDVTSKRLSKCFSKMAALTRDLINQYASVGVKDLRGLDQLYKTITTWRESYSQHEEFEQSLQDSARKAGIPLASIMELAELPLDEVESRWGETDSALDNTNQLINNTHETLGRLRAESNELGHDGLLASLRFQSAAVDAQIHKLEECWRVWATCEDISQRVRTIYETQRQPETLRDASQWLEEITSGRYVRLWTPLGEDLLYVDDAQGQSWLIETLSRGTRESVYLSLRLALVRSYQQDGVALPLILDDVFVNFDLSRLRNAVNAIKRFSVEVGQVLFFTCHAHIAALFEDIGADIRPIERPSEIRAPHLPKLAYAYEPPSHQSSKQIPSPSSVPSETEVAEAESSEIAHSEDVPDTYDGSTDPFNEKPTDRDLAA